MGSVLGLDFGTTNTVGAAPDRGGPLVFRHDGVADSVFRTSLCFWRDRSSRHHATRAEAGPWAIDALLRLHDAARFFQSIKTYAASPHFKTTNIFGQSVRYEDLMALFLEKYVARLEDFSVEDVSTVVVGRPVAYSGAAASPALAESRYRSAFAALGIENLHFVYEPVAAAYYFIQRLATDEIVFVADLGGGTSDFTVFEFVRSAGRVDIRPLGVSGIGVAGDNFDQRIISRVVAPALGKGSRYRSFGSEYELPVAYYADISRWNLLSVMHNEKTIAELEKLSRSALEPDKIARLIDFIEMERAYEMYRAISTLKTTLSSAEAGTLELDLGDVTLRETVTRSDFEAWIEPDLERIAAAAGRALAEARLDAGAVTRVFLTGGSSRIPAVREMFARTFPRVAIESGDELVSIARGLALVGQDADIGKWSVREADVPGLAPARRMFG